VFERFTERARQVVVLAHDEARALKHNYIGTEHLLLGLLREDRGVAARVLESFDITVEEVRAQVARIVGRGDEVTTGPIPFTPRTKKVLELSLREALSLGHNYIGTEHLLLGLARENEGVAARILLDFGCDAQKIRNEVIRVLSGAAGPLPVEAEHAEDPMVTSEWLSLDPAPTPTSVFDEVREVQFVLGWLLFGVALAVGILIGWLIWA
jgi:ATP-dependent Clp protease ATP-binding subunit ClpC